MATQISQMVVRQDSAENWIDGGWLDKGELGYDQTYHVLKIGTANRQAWNDALTINDNVTLESLGIIATKDEINILHGVVISSTILNYLQNVRSDVQEQIDNKSSNTHTHTINITGTTETSEQITTVASAEHHHDYEQIKSMKEAGAHMHTVNVPTQTFESDESGKFVLVFGVQTINTSELGNHTHELILRCLIYFPRQSVFL